MSHRRPVYLLSKERQTEVLNELQEASSPGFDYFVLVILSCSIATFGLIINSTAVIIGAMLVAPLMSPILGLSLATVAGEQRMFRRAIIALGEGILLAVALSTLLGWIARALPFDILNVLPGEILSRTHPTPFDLGIALAGGAAASYALAQPRLSAALPGVAIATALMPPLCTAGIGLSLGNTEVTLGAVLLFFTNLTAISFAGIVVFAALGFHPLHLENTWHRIPRSMFVSAILVILTAAPLVFLTQRAVNEANYLKKIRSTVTSELNTLPDAQLVQVDIDTSNSVLHLAVTIRTPRQPDYTSVVTLQKNIADRLQRTTALQLIVVPMTKLDPLIPPTRTKTPSVTPTFTPGPSLTPTSTLIPTSTPTITPTNTPPATFTPTGTTTPLPSSTPTETFTPTLSATPTQTFTPTPILAYIANTGGAGTYLRQSPAGKILALLPEGTPVLVLYQRETVNGQEWIEVRDVLNRIGWVQSYFLSFRP